MYRDNVLRKVRAQRLLHDVTLELTYACNLDCFFCYNDREKPGTPLSLDQYRTLLEDLARMQTLFLMLSGGEPMVHPHFFEIGGMARELGFVVRVRTNGHTLSPRNVERLRHGVHPYMVEAKPARGQRRGARASDPCQRQLRAPGAQSEARPRGGSAVRHGRDADRLE